MIPDAGQLKYLTGPELEDARAALHEGGHALTQIYSDGSPPTSVRLTQHAGGVTAYPYDDGVIRPVQAIAVFLAGLVAEEWLGLPGAGERGCESDLAAAREIGREWDGTIGGLTWQKGRQLAEEAMERGVGAALVPFATLLQRRGYLAGPELESAISYALYEVGYQSLWTPEQKRMHEAREQRKLDMVPVRQRLYDQMVERGVLGAMGVRDAWAEAGRLAGEWLDTRTPPNIPDAYPEAPPRPQRRASASVGMYQARGART